MASGQRRKESLENVDQQGVAAGNDWRKKSQRHQCASRTRPSESEPVSQEPADTETQWALAGYLAGPLANEPNSSVGLCV